VKNVTKDKGDIGLACVMADLMKCGIKIALPLSEHLPFDLIAVNNKGQLSRVSVKYRTATDGSFEVSTCGVWSNRKGSHRRQVDISWLDAVAVYCPDTSTCYYIPISAFANKKSMVLRTIQPATAHGQNQIAKIAFADRFIHPVALWEMAEGSGLAPQPG
jgi:hypothetical protein